MEYSLGPQDVLRPLRSRSIVNPRNISSNGGILRLTRGNIDRRPGRHQRKELRSDIPGKTHTAVSGVVRLDPAAMESVGALEFHPERHGIFPITHRALVANLCVSRVIAHRC